MCIYIYIYVHTYIYNIMGTYPSSYFLRYVGAMGIRQSMDMPIFFGGIYGIIQGPPKA